MSDFPSLHIGAAKRTQVDYEGERFSCFQVVQGTDASLMPSGLPTPHWFVAINPYGFDDAETDAFDLGECFNYDPDGRVMKITGASLAEVQAALLAQAKIDANDHVEVDNGGLYAVWVLPDALVLGGFDNGGSDIAQGAIDQVVEQLGFMVLVKGADAHFQVQTLRESAKCGSLHGEEVGALQIAEELHGWVERQEIDEQTTDVSASTAGPRL